MAKVKKDSVKSEKTVAEAGASKPKKKFRTLLPPANLGTISREEIRKGIKEVIAQRTATG